MSAEAYRGSAEGWLAGICAGVANRFGWNVYVVRAGVIIATIATAGVGGIVTYALVAQFAHPSQTRHGAAFKTSAFWFLVFFWSLIPMLYVVFPLSLVGIIDWEAAAGLYTVLGVANGAVLPFILVVFCIVRLVRWRQRRTTQNNERIG